MTTFTDPKEVLALLEDMYEHGYAQKHEDMDLDISDLEDLVVDHFVEKWPNVLLLGELPFLIDTTIRVARFAEGLGRSHRVEPVIVGIDRLPEFRGVAAWAAENLTGAYDVCYGHIGFAHASDAAAFALRWL